MSEPKKFRRNLFGEDISKVFERYEEFKKSPSPRITLPVMIEKNKINVWSILKSIATSDLTRITMPISLNEPISFLQRFVEDLEYSELLMKACQADVISEALAFIGTFAVCSYSTINGRYSKPFNPLLGETYEYVDSVNEYSVICEQVSHHPPVSALHAESNDWVFYQDYSISIGYTGNSIKINPSGSSHVILKNRGWHFWWVKPTTYICNIIFGTLYVYMSAEITVKVVDKPCSLNLDIKTTHNKVINITGEILCNRDIDEFSIMGNLGHHIQKIKENTVQTLWSKKESPKLSEKMYGFTYFTVGLNEMNEAIRCPTDSRFRPDQKLLEEGNVIEAGIVKRRLEDKQRNARKERLEKDIDWQPKWFEYGIDSDTGLHCYLYTGKYWTAVSTEINKTKFPDIF